MGNFVFPFGHRLPRDVQQRGKLLLRVFFPDAECFQFITECHYLSPRVQHSRDTHFCPLRPVSRMLRCVAAAFLSHFRLVNQLCDAARLPRGHQPQPLRLPLREQPDAAAEQHGKHGQVPAVDFSRGGCRGISSKRLLSRFDEIQSLLQFVYTLMQRTISRDGARFLR